MKIPYSPLRFLILACCLTAGGCGGFSGLIPPPQADPTRYFVLSAPAPAADTGAAAAAAHRAQRLRVGLRSVSLAAYLRTRTIVLRVGPNEIVLDDFQRWAEPLADGIGRLLLAELAADPAVASVAPQPFSFDSERDYDIAVEVTRCEGARDADGRSFARFAAVFEIRTPAPDSRLVIRRSFVAADAPWDGKDYGQLAAELGDAVSQLGDRIVLALTAAPRPPAPTP